MSCRELSGWELRTSGCCPLHSRTFSLELFSYRVPCSGLRHLSISLRLRSRDWHALVSSLKKRAAELETHSCCFDEFDRHEIFLQIRSPGSEFF